MKSIYKASINWQNVHSPTTKVDEVADRQAGWQITLAHCRSQSEYAALCYTLNDLLKLMIPCVLGTFVFYIWHMTVMQMIIYNNKCHLIKIVLWEPSGGKFWAYWAFKIQLQHSFPSVRTGDQNCTRAWFGCPERVK